MSDPAGPASAGAPCTWTDELRTVQTVVEGLVRSVEDLQRQAAVAVQVVTCVETLQAHVGFALNQLSAMAQRDRARKAVTATAVLASDATEPIQDTELRASILAHEKTLQQHEVDIHSLLETVLTLHQMPAKEERADRDKKSAGGKRSARAVAKERRNSAAEQAAGTAARRESEALEPSTVSRQPAPVSPTAPPDTVAAACSEDALAAEMPGGRRAPAPAARSTSEPKAALPLDEISPAVEARSASPLVAETIAGPAPATQTPPSTNTARWRIHTPEKSDGPASVGTAASARTRSPSSSCIRGCEGQENGRRRVPGLVPAPLQPAAMREPPVQEEPARHSTRAARNSTPVSLSGVEVDVEVAEQWQRTRRPNTPSSLTEGCDDSGSCSVGGADWKPRAVASTSRLLGESSARRRREWEETGPDAGLYEASWTTPATTPREPPLTRHSMPLLGEPAATAGAAQGRPARTGPAPGSARSSRDSRGNPQEPFAPRSLFAAIEVGDEAAALYLLSHADSAEVNARDKASRTALHCAARAGLAAVCTALLERPDFSEANAQDIRGHTALHGAALRGRAEVCRALLACPGFTGADSEDHMGRSALDCARLGGHDEVVRALLERPRTVKEAASKDSHTGGMETEASRGNETERRQGKHKRIWKGRQ